MKHLRLAVLPLIVGLASVLDPGDSTPPDEPTSRDETRTVPVDGGAYTSVTARGLAAMLEHKDFHLVNVHIPYAGEIEGTDDFVPFDQIEQHIERFPEDRSARIVLYCRSEGMGVTSATQLVRIGFTDVWNLEGGMNAWTAAGGDLLNIDRSDP